MIGFLRGRIADKQPNILIIDVQGVGYEVHVPLSTFYDVGDVGADIMLRIYTHVREDALQLYGFLTELERQLFERLIGISGIGPKLAIAVLSGMDPREVLSAVQRGDVAQLTGIPGIGKKTSERLGYHRPQAEKAIDSSLQAMSDPTFEQALKAALRELMR